MSRCRTPSGARASNKLATRPISTGEWAATKTIGTVFVVRFGVAGDPGDVPARAGKAFHEAILDWLTRAAHDDRNGARRVLRRAWACDPCHDDHIGLEA